jgi:hypothetical protein
MCTFCRLRDCGFLDEPSPLGKIIRQKVANLAFIIGGRIDCD